MPLAMHSVTNMLLESLKRPRIGRFHFLYWEVSMPPGMLRPAGTLDARGVAERGFSGDLPGMSVEK